MKTDRIVCALALMPFLILIFVSHAKAERGLGFITGNELLDLCRQPVRSPDQRDCLGYVTGIADALQSPRGIGGLRACLEPGIQRRQLYEIVLQYLEKHPIERNKLAGGLVAMALLEAYPCP